MIAETMITLHDAIDVLDQAVNALAICADHLQTSVEYQIIAMTTQAQREAGDYAAIRNHLGATFLNEEIRTLRLVEAVIGTEGRDAPLWLQGWIDDWPLMDAAEIAALVEGKTPARDAEH